jgi:hypothetical protein
VSDQKLPTFRKTTRYELLKAQVLNLTKEKETVVPKNEIILCSCTADIFEILNSTVQRAKPSIISMIPKLTSIVNASHSYDSACTGSAGPCRSHIVYNIVTRILFLIV